MEKRKGISRLKMVKDDLLFGWHPVLEALEAGADLQKILLLQGLRNEKSNLVLARAKELEVPVQFVPQQKLDRITRKNHQGIIAFGSPITFADLEHLTSDLYDQGIMPRFLAFDGITDVRNFGAICRTAECFGIHAVIVPSKGMAPINDEAVKSSSGALLRLPVCRVAHWGHALKFLADAGIPMIGMTEKASELLDKSQFGSPMCMVLGNEETGLSPETLRACDRLVRIPMPGEISSLNVGAAAAIALYVASASQLDV